MLSDLYDKIDQSKKPFAGLRLMENPGDQEIVSQPIQGLSAAGTLIDPSAF